MIRTIGCKLYAVRSAGLWTFFSPDLACRDRNLKIRKGDIVVGMDERYVEDELEHEAFRWVLGILPSGLVRWVPSENYGSNYGSTYMVEMEKK